MVNSILNISEATAIGLHAAILLAEMRNIRLSARQMSKILQVSQAHLAKVLQLLNKAGIVSAAYGPAGGYTLARLPEEITLLDIYQAIEGPMKPSNCLLKKRICNGKKCFMGGLITSINKQMYEHFSKTRLSELTNIFKDYSKNQNVKQT